MGISTFSFYRTQAAKVCAMVLCATSLLQTTHAIEYEQGASDYPFSDISATSEIGQAALELYNRKIMGGYPDGTIQIANNIVRAEAAKFLVNAGNIPAAPYANNFADVRGDEWFAEYVGASTNANIIKGYPDGNFRPARYINRSELGTMLERLNPSVTFNRHVYTDVPTDVWFERGAEAAVYYGVFEPSQKYYPDLLVTREEVIRGLSNMLLINEGKKIAFAPGAVPTDGSLGYGNGRGTGGNNGGTTNGGSNTGNTGTTGGTNGNTGSGTNSGGSTNTGTGGGQTVTTGTMEVTLVPVTDVMTAQPNQVVYHLDIENKATYDEHIDEVEVKFTAAGMNNSNMSCGIFNAGHQQGETEEPNAFGEMKFYEFGFAFAAGETKRLSLVCDVDDSQEGHTLSFAFGGLMASNLSTGDDMNIVTLNPSAVGVIAIENANSNTGTGGNTNNNGNTGGSTNTGTGSGQTVTTGTMEITLDPVAGTTFPGQNQVMYHLDIQNKANHVADLWSVGFTASGVNNSALECGLFYSGHQLGRVGNPRATGKLSFDLFRISFSANETKRLSLVCDIDDSQEGHTLSFGFEELAAMSVLNGDMMSTVIVNPSATGTLTIHPLNYVVVTPQLSALTDFDAQVGADTTVYKVDIENQSTVSDLTINEFDLEFNLSTERILSICDLYAESGMLVDTAALNTQGIAAFSMSANPIVIGMAQTETLTVKCDAKENPRPFETHNGETFDVQLGNVSSFEFISTASANVIPEDHITVVTPTKTSAFTVVE